MKEILVIFFYYVILAKFIKAELYAFYLFTYVYVLVSSLANRLSTCLPCLPYLLSSFAVTHGVGYDRFTLLGCWDGVGE